MSDVRHLHVITERPTKRSQCVDGPRPCPWVSCRQHLYLDVQPGGSIKFPFADLEVWEIPETCALDVADAHHGRSQAEIGHLLDLTRQRVQQIEAAALRQLAVRGVDLREYLVPDRLLLERGDVEGISLSDSSWSDSNFLTSDRFPPRRARA